MLTNQEGVCTADRLLAVHDQVATLDDAHQICTQTPGCSHFTLNLVGSPSAPTDKLRLRIWYRISLSGLVVPMCNMQHWGGCSSAKRRLPKLRRVNGVLLSMQFPLWRCPSRCDCAMNGTLHTSVLPKTSDASTLQICGVDPLGLQCQPLFQHWHVVRSGLQLNPSCSCPQMHPQSISRSACSAC